MEPFKNIFNKKSVKILADQIEEASKGKFKKTKFLKAINKDLESLELKDRVRLISNCLATDLSPSYKENIKFLIKTLASEGAEDGVTGFMTWPLLQYVEDYGLEDFDTSFDAMYEMTKRFSAEFAIRPFLIADDKRVFKILNKWKKDKNYHVRRLCSEGIRPNLPWGLKVPVLNENLERNLKLINSLKDDSEEYVRRSVANHLNDISRLDEKLMLSTAKEWSKNNPSADRVWVIRHATRTLLKQGHPQALKLHGYNPKPKIETSSPKLNKKKIKEGESLQLKLKIKSKSKSDQKIIGDYIIHFLKKNGEYSKKPFRFKDGVLKGGETLEIDKKITFKKVTTRTHYSGLHKISVQINGVEGGSTSFQLTV